MSMEEIIRKMKEDDFSKYMNQPIETIEQSMITYDKNNIAWVTCPYCKKRQFPLSKDAVIKRQVFKCKASYCRKYFKTDV